MFIGRLRRIVILMAAVTVLLCAAGITASAAEYYISSSEGNDANAGTADAPWQTLAKANEYDFQPDDIIYLKCGDVWEETFRPHSSGNADVHIPSGKWNDSGFITLTSYGEGERPVIKAGNSRVYGILFLNVGGWKVKNIEVCNTYAGIRIATNKSGCNPDGFWITDCYIHDIKDAPQYPTQTEYNLYMSYGISCVRDNSAGNVPTASNVKIENTLFEDNDTPITIYRADGLIIENVVAYNNYKEGILLSQINMGNEEYSAGSYMRNCRILRTGEPKGMYWGTAGLQFNEIFNFDISQCEIAYTKSPGKPDGVGIDYEGNNVNVTVRNCYIHDNEGAGIMVMENPTWGIPNQGTVIKDNIISFNGLKNINNTPAALIHKNNYESTGEISGNRIYTFSNQAAVSIGKENQRVIHSPWSGYTTTWPEANYTVRNNAITVVNPSTELMDGSRDEQFMKELMGEDYEYVSYFNNSMSDNAGKAYTMYDPSRTVFNEDDIETVYEFNFENAVKAHEWTMGQSVSNLHFTNSDGVTALGGTITGSDPYIYSPANLNINMDENDVMIIRMRQNTGDREGRIFFKTIENPSWNSRSSDGFSLVHDADGYTTYYIDFSYIYTWTGTLDQIRIDPSDCTSGEFTGDFYIDYIKIGKLRNRQHIDPGPDEVILGAATSSVSEKTEAQAVNPLTLKYLVQWDFNTDNNTEGWIGKHSVADFKTQSNELSAVITAADPYILSPDNLDIKIDPNKQYILKLRFRQSTGRGRPSIYFTTNEAPSFSESRFFNLNDVDYSSDSYIDFCVDLSTISSFAGTLKQIRFDPIDNSENPAGSFALDYLYICENVPYVSEHDFIWALDALEYMDKSSFSPWTMDSSFDPLEDVTRGELAEIFYKALNLRTDAYAGEYSDVTPNTEQAECIAAVSAAGIMKGVGDGCFAPEEKVSREQAAAVFARAAELVIRIDEELTAPSFADFDSVSEYARKAVMLVADMGIMHGDENGCLNPNQNLNRAEMSVMIMQLLKEEAFQVLNICTPMIREKTVFSDEYPYLCTFDTEGDTEGWQAVNSVTDLAAADGELRGVISARDPYIRSADNLNIDISKCKKIVVRFRHNTGKGNLGIFFTTTDDAKWDDAKHIEVVSATSSEDFAEYTFDLSNNGKFTGKLKQLRIDPIGNYDNVTGEFALDYIYICE